jgi:hypothetical protein
MLFTGVVFIFAILAPGLSLSKKKRYARFLWLAGSIGIEIFVQGFYIPRYAISWFAPGYFAMIACDLLLMWRGTRMIRDAKQGKQRAQDDG